MERWSDLTGLVAAAWPAIVSRGDATAHATGMQVEEVRESVLTGAWAESAALCTCTMSDSPCSHSRTHCYPSRMLVCIHACYDATRSVLAKCQPAPRSAAQVAQAAQLLIRQEARRHVHARARDTTSARGKRLAGVRGSLQVLACGEHVMCTRAVS